MNLYNKYNGYFVIILLISILISLYIIINASISYKEAEMYFANSLVISKLANISTSYFGKNDLTLKIPNIILNSLNLLFIYLISNKILKRRIDSIICITIYSLIPGVILQGVILNETSLSLLVVLVICYIEITSKKLIYPIFVIAIFIDSSCFILFLALVCYAIYYKKTKTIFFALICFALNLHIYGIDLSGKPIGNVLNVISELSLLYSPPLFIYYIYTLYRNITKENKSLLLFVSITSIVVSILLSIRQEVDKEIFLFMSLCGIPLMIKQFLSDIRTRLPQFQGSYKNRFIIVLACLMLEVFLLIFSKYVYLINNENKIFLDQFYIVKELSYELKKRNIKQVTTDPNLQQRLRFYDIKDGGAILKRVEKGGNIIIKYNNIIVARYII